MFTSADTGTSLALHAEGLAGPVVDFASNRLVAIVAPALLVTSSNLLSTLLNPAITLGTSTAVYDPLGDYTEQMFGKADAIVPGAQAPLDAKAQRLVASPSSPPVPAGQNSLVYFVDTAHQADVFITYYTSAIAALQVAPDLQEVGLPANLATSAEYGMTILNGADPGTSALENYILSPTAQAVLASNRFGAPAPVPEPGSMGLLGLALIGLLATGRSAKLTGCTLANVTRPDFRCTRG